MTYLPRLAAHLHGGVPQAGQQLEQALHRSGVSEGADNISPEGALSQP